MIITLAILCSLVIIITDGVMLCNSFKGLTSLYLPMCFSSQKGFNGKVDIKFQWCLYLIFWVSSFRRRSFNFTYLVSKNLCNNGYLVIISDFQFLFVSVFLLLVVHLISKIEPNFSKKLMIIKFIKISLFPLSVLILPLPVEFSQSIHGQPWIKFCSSNLDLSLSKVFNFLNGWFQKVSGTLRNCGRWSDTVAVRLTQYILPTGVLELLLIFGDFTIWRRNILKRQWVEEFIWG